MPCTKYLCAWVLSQEFGHESQKLDWKLRLTTQREVKKQLEM